MIFILAAEKNIYFYMNNPNSIVKPKNKTPVENLPITV